MNVLNRTPDLESGDAIQWCVVIKKNAYHRQLRYIYQILFGKLEKYFKCFIKPLHV